MQPIVSLLVVLVQAIILTAVNTEIAHDSFYHEHEEFVRKDRCSFQDPEFPFALSKLSGYRKTLIIIHGVIMVWIFTFLIPVSIFPVLWHRLAPNELVGYRQIKKWIWIHMLFTYPVYPLLAAAVICAMVARHDIKQVLPNSSCSFYNSFHDLLGIVCFIAYTLHFFLSFFTSEALHSEHYKTFRFYHSLCNLLAYFLSVPLMAMARISSMKGSKRYLYTLPYFFFVLFQVFVNIRMKFADFGALEWHMVTEAGVANENKGIMLRTSQWIWNFGFPSKGRNDLRLIDLPPQRSVSRIRIEQFLDTYKFYWRLTLVVCFITSVLMTAHFGLLHDGIYFSSAHYLPNWQSLGDFSANWSTLEVYAL